MKTHDLGDLMQEYGRHLETQMTPLDLDEVSVYEAKPRPRATSNRWMPVWGVAVAVSVVVLAVAALFLAFSNDRDEVADTAPTPTTLAPDVETMSDFEIMQAGVTSLYSGNADRAAELFELPDRTDDEIRQESVYQAAIGGRLTLNCDLDIPGEFQCLVPYQNALTDAIGERDSPGDRNRIVVEDGVITAFGFPEHTWIVVEIGTFLAIEGRFEGYEECVSGPFPESCATVQMENLDAWVEWREDVEPIDVVEVALESWYGGNCETAQFLLDSSVGCSTSSEASQTIEYESILGAQVTVENCEETGSSSEFKYLSCEIHYSNAMNSAVGKPPSVTSREFTAWSPGRVLSQEQPWYEVDYPEDTELRESFRLFAERGELQDVYAAAGCASARTPVCADLILDNLEDWANWYETDG